MREQLEQWLSFFQARGHILHASPANLFQHAANEPDESPLSRAAKHRYQSGLEKRVWLEWTNKPQKTGACLLVIDAHGGGTGSCCYSPDNKWIASASFDRTAKIFDATSGCEVSRINERLQPLKFCRFSPDSERLVTADFYGSVRLWDVPSCAPVSEPEPHQGEIQFCSFSSDGSVLVTGTWSEVKIRDGLSGSIIITILSDGSSRQFSESLSSQPSGDNRLIIRWALSPDGTRMALCFSDDSAVLFDLNGRAIADIGPSDSCTFSPDSSLLVTSFFEGQLSVRDAVTGALRVNCDTDSKPAGQAVAVSIDNSRIIALNGQQPTLWDAVTGQSIATLKPHANRITQASFSPKGDKVVTSSKDGMLYVSDTQAGRLNIQLAGHLDSVSSFDVSPDGMRLVSAADDGVLRVWSLDAETNTSSEHAFRGIAQFCSFSPRDALLATSHWDALLKLWDGQSGEAVATLYGPDFTGYEQSDGINAMTFSPCGKKLACVLSPFMGTNRPTLRIWDLLSLQETQLVDGPTSSQQACVFSPDGRVLIAAGVDGLRLFDPDDGRELKWVDKGTCLTTLTLSRNGKLVAAGSRDGRISVWQLSDTWTGRPHLSLLKSMDHDHAARSFRDVTACAFTPDGSQLVTISSNRSVVWDVATFAEVAVNDNQSQDYPETTGPFAVDGPNGHRSFPPAAWKTDEMTRLSILDSLGIITLSPDTRHSISTELRALTIWDLHSGASRVEYRDDGLATVAAWSANGQRVALGDSRGTVRFLSLRNFKPGPIFTIPWQSSVDGRTVAGCSLCRRWFRVTEPLGRSINCPNCTAQLQLSSLVIEGDWSLVEEAWGSDTK